MDLLIDHVYADKYRVVRVLGQGAMGAVYEAENVRIRRRVAIKAIHAGLAGKRDAVARFELEAQAAGRIGSRHITEVLDTGQLADGTRFMVMEFLEGATLHERIRTRGRLKPEEIAPIAVELLDGLAAAHRAGIVHRDLKPANVFLVATEGADFVKVLDFGVSKFNALDGGEGMNMTSTGMILGTPFYMSPEQAKGLRLVDRRSDLYSVGVILYEAITGQVPFSAETFNELIFRIVLESPPPAEQFVPDLDGAFAVILRKAMARDADQRFQTAEEFRAVLAAWLEMHAEPSLSLAEGGTMMMAGARGGTVMLDGAPTTPFVSQLAAASPAPFGVTAPLPPPSGASAAVALSEPSVARSRARRGSGTTMIAVVAMSVACVTMGGAAAILLSRGPAARSPSEPISPTAEAAPSSTSAPVSTAVAAPPEPTAPPPTAEPAGSDAPPESPHKDRTAQHPTAAPAPRPPAERPQPVAAPAPIPAPAPAATKRTISGDL
jgi:eukaryotic-like serine/threonine-protein kinase